jgi:hypothetical protein
MFLPREMRGAEEKEPAARDRFWRVFGHFLTHFPLLNNLVVFEAKDVDKRDPRTSRREPNSSMNCYEVSIFKSTHGFKVLSGKCERTFLHPS